MKDFFDEDFPLSKKQEEELKLAKTPKTLEVPPVKDGPQIFEPVETEEAPESIGFDIFSEPEKEPEVDPKEYLEQLLSIAEKKKEEAEVEEESSVTKEAEVIQFEEGPSEEETLEEDTFEADLGFDLNTEAEEAEEDDEPLTLDGSDDVKTVQFETNGFSYEYDERYYAEEETPAYKYPELHKKTPAPKAESKSPSVSVKVDVKKLLTVGAAVATAVAATKLLGTGKKKKKK